MTEIERLSTDENVRQLSGIAGRPAAAWLRITGSDALAFLQGQFSQELRPDRAAPVQYGLWLNQKGRVLADSHVVRGGEGEWWIGSVEGPAEVIRRRLEDYIIADDVEVVDCSADWSHWWLAGEAGRRWCAEQGASLPGPGCWSRLAGGWLYPSRVGADVAWELHLPPDATVRPVESLTAADVERARILAGVPAVPRDVGPTDLAAEGGLEAEAISFTKGCYLGQEVVARLQAMGRVRRRLVRIAAPTGAPPPRGAAVYQRNGSVGEVRSAVSLGAGWCGFAMVSLSGWAETEPLSLAIGEEGTILPLGGGGAG